MQTPRPSARTFLLLIASASLLHCQDPAEQNKPPLSSTDAARADAYVPKTPATDASAIALVDEVEIIFDADNIPHIYAKNDVDLFYASGYQVATDRLFTLDINRRKATSRLAEVLGEEGVSNDIQAHVLGFDRWAGPSIEAMAKLRPRDYELFVAYVAGINRRVEEVLANEKPLPEGFERNDYAPEPFSPRDLLAIGMRIQFGYSSTLEFDLLTSILALTRRQQFEQFHIFAPGSDAFTMVWGAGYDPAALQPSLSGSDTSPLDRLPEPRALDPAEVQRTIDALHTFRHNLRIGEGSNAWSIHGDFSANGKPIVANDSHSGLRNPNDLYLMHLNSRDAGGSFDVMGFAFIGIPAIHLGHNHKLAWAATTHFADMTDLWDVRVDRDEGTASLGGFPFPLKSHEVIIKVRAGSGEFEERAFTVEEIPGQGVLLPDEMLPLPKNLLVRGELMLGWPGWAPNTEIFMFFDFDRAETLEEFTSAISQQRVGMQNWQAATAKGHAYRTHGDVPDRGPIETRSTPNMIMDARDPDSLWLRGFLGEEHLPALDGSQPFLMTANNDPWGHTADNDPLDDPFYYGSFYAPGYRAAELVEQLEALTSRGDITIEEMQQLQLDQRSLVAPKIIPRLATIIESLPPDAEECMRDIEQPLECRATELSGAVAALEAWDGTMSATSGEALLFRIWLGFASQRVLEPAASAALFYAIDDAQPVTLVKLFAHALTKEDSTLIDRDAELEIAAALADAIDEVARIAAEKQMQEGDVFECGDGVDACWGDLHQARYTTPDVAAHPEEGSSFDRTGGDDTSINVAQSRCWQPSEEAESGYVFGPCQSNAGAVFRTITSFDEDDRPVTLFNWPKGNGPGTEDWIEGVYKPWAFSREEVEQGAREAITLTPSGQTEGE